MTLAEFIAARLGEDERGARYYIAESPNQGPQFIETVYPYEGLGERMLREVAAKRAILAEHTPGYPTTYPKPSGQPTCSVCHAGGWEWEPEKWPCATVRALAAIWADHPDYRQGWKP